MNTASNNFSQAELDKFGALANRWWDPDGPQKALHALNPVRLQYVRDRARLAGATALDVGCGGGLLSEALASEGAQVTAIDLAPELVKVARLNRLETGVKVDYQLRAVESRAEERPGSFDVITYMEMLEHVPDPDSVVRACAQLVKPGGWVFFSTINRNAKAFMLAIVGAEYVLGMLPRGTHEYAKFIRPSELALSCRSAQLDIQHTRGLEYNPITRRYWLSGDTSVNYLLATRRAA